MGKGKRCPKLANRSQLLVGRTSPYCKDMWRRYCCLTGFFPIVDTCLRCEDIARQSCAMVGRWRFFASCISSEFVALQQWSPLPSNRHHPSSGDCLWRVRGKTIRSVLCTIVCNNCAQCDAHTHEQTYSSLDWVLSHWAHFTVLDSFLYCVLLCVVCMIA